MLQNEEGNGQKIYTHTHITQTIKTKNVQPHSSDEAIKWDVTFARKIGKDILNGHIPFSKT